MSLALAVPRAWGHQTPARPQSMLGTRRGRMEPRHADGRGASMIEQEPLKHDLGPRPEEAIPPDVSGTSAKAPGEAPVPSTDRDHKSVATFTAIVIGVFVAGFTVAFGVQESRIALKNDMILKLERIINTAKGINDDLFDFTRSEVNEYRQTIAALRTLLFARQELYTGAFFGVVKSKEGASIENAEISIPNGSQAISNVRGEFYIGTKPGDELHVRKVGFEPFIYVVKYSDFGSQVELALRRVKP